MKDEIVRKELLDLLRGGKAHMSFEEVVNNFPLNMINDKAPNMPYAPWHILEHMRRAQKDILLFILDPDYVSPPWPKDFFPSPSEKTDQQGWELIVQGFLADRGELEKIVRDRTTDLFAPLAHAQEYNIFREIILTADHSAYHIGEIAFMRQTMKAWPPDDVLYDATG